MRITDITEGDFAVQLKAVRDHLAERLPSVSALHVAPIARVLVDVLTKLDEMPDAAGGSVADDLAARRADRRQKATGS